jgi:hypothetical protein
VTSLSLVVPVVSFLFFFLYGQELHLRTDYYALTWLMSFRNLEGQTARWIQRLREYYFTSEHRQDRKHKSGKGSTGFMLEAILKNGAERVTPVRPVADHGPEIGADITERRWGAIRKDRN